jgi:hypothetical protein
MDKPFTPQTKFVDHAEPMANVLGRVQAQMTELMMLKSRVDAAGGIDAIAANAAKMQRSENIEPRGRSRK